MKKCIFIMVQLLMSAHYVWGQEVETALPIDVNEQAEHAVEWVPKLLNANSNILYNTIVFNGRPFGWNLRGEAFANTKINNVSFVSPLNKWRYWDLFSGMQTGLHKITSSINGVFSDQSFEQHQNVNYLATDLPAGSRSVIVGASIGNTIASNNIRFQMNTLPDVRNWQSRLHVNMQYAAPNAIIPGYKQALSIMYVAEKQMDKKRQIGMAILWNYQDQSKGTTAVGEAFALANYNLYNPTWGWYHQKPFFSSTKQSNAPIISFSYRHDINEHTYFKLNNAIIIGRQSQSSLSWTQTADPRPDYYRYLPSYAMDTALRNALTAWYNRHPDNLQINFDNLSKINQSTKDGRSFYMVNQQNSDLLLFHGSFIYSKYLGGELNVSWGVHYLFDRIEYSNQIKDLLGGNYYFNYNSWINDDGINANFQNDILRPDRKIIQHESWGSQYAIQAVQVNPWIQLSKSYAKLELAMGMGFGIQALNRIGYNKNGMFPLTSMGKSSFLFSDAKDFKAQLLYKFSGRFYLRTLVFAQWKLPTVESSYIDPASSLSLNPYLQNEQVQGADLTFFYRTPYLKLYTSVYVKYSFGASNTKLFYHDLYNSFVYGLVGNINKSNTGLEMTAELPLFQRVQFTFVSTLQKNTFINNAPYQLLFMNDLKIMASGITYLNNLPAETVPSFTNAVTLQYQPANSIRLGLTMVYAMEKPVAVDLLRRSSEVKVRLDPLSWSTFQQAIFLPDKGVINAFISRASQIKGSSKTFRLYTSLSVRNILNEFIPIVAYEQARFDYIHFNNRKYDVKYLLDQGVSYTLRFQLQIQ